MIFAAQNGKPANEGDLIKKFFENYKKIKDI